MATTVKQTITEVDVVEFTEPIDKAEVAGIWPAGTRGTVVIDLDDHHKMVEISHENGETLDMPVVPVEKLKLITGTVWPEDGLDMAPELLYEEASQHPVQSPTSSAAA